MAWAWADPIRRAAQAAARDHGIEVVELAGWRERGHGTTQGVLRGTIWHDTVTTAGMSRGDLFALLRDGYKSLPGPIANVGLDRDGTLGLIAAGRAYHAGAGDWPGIPSGNLNACGIEVANGGSGSGERWTRMQLAVARTFTAELHRGAGLPADRLVGHGAPSARRPPNEWTTRKVDPWSVDMPAERDRLATEALMATLDDEDIDRIAAALDTKLRWHLFDRRYYGSSLAARIRRLGVDVGRLPDEDELRQAIREVAAAGGDPDQVADAVVAALADALGG